MNRKGQVAVFIIIALVIIGGVVVYFVFREDVMIGKGIPAELVPVFEYYQSCIEQSTKGAIWIAGEQGGRVEVTDYFPGSEYAPFSSHLNFFGVPVPYWYYISANGVIKEQVPSESEMEREIADYIEEDLANCDFEHFYQQGFVVERGSPNVNIDVQDTKVEVEVSEEMTVRKADDVGRKTAHTVEVTSKLGKFYNLAKEIYEEQKQNAFLEEYAVDVLYMYAPVDGVEIQCGPKVWSTENVMTDIREGLEANFMTLKFKGNYYDLKGERRDYFVLDKEVDEAVNIMYSKNWPTKIEIFGDGVDEAIMISEATGTQEGMGMMGFCYVPYHFVYDVSFPVLIQIYNTEEMFQFPVSVIIDNNMPREMLFSGTVGGEEEFDLCEFKTKEIEVNLYDVNLNPVNANVSYECFSQRCRLGESKNGKLTSVAPACVNGFLHVQGGGFAEKKQLFSTNDNRIADIILEREHEIEVELEVGGNLLDGMAIVSFVRDDGRTSAVALPGDNKVKLAEGSYEVKVYVYGDSSITIPATTKSECVDVPRSGLLGFLGMTKEKCFDISLPETKIEYALIGGGKVETYFLETELEKGSLVLKVDKLPVPNSIEMLAYNFELFETKGVDYAFNE